MLDPGGLGYRPGVLIQSRFRPIPLIRRYPSRKSRDT